MKTKIKCFGDKATDFHEKEMPKAGSNCLAVTTIHSALKKEESDYPHVFVKELNTLKKKWLGILLKMKKFFLANLMKNKLKLNVIIIFF